MNQDENHVYYQKWELHELLMKHGTAMQAWSPLAQGLLNLSDQTVLKKIASKYNKTPAQIILRWHLQRGIVSLPKSVHKERIIQNADIFDFELSKEDMQIMMSMDLRESTGRGYPEQYEY